MATSATANWPTVDWLRASRYTVVARQVWSASGWGSTDISHNNMESFIPASSLLYVLAHMHAKSAVAVDGRADRSTWIAACVETRGASHVLPRNTAESIDMSDVDRETFGKLRCVRGALMCSVFAHMASCTPA